MKWLRNKFNYVKRLFSKREGVVLPVTEPHVNVSAANSDSTPYEWALSQLGVHERTSPEQVGKYLKTVSLAGYDPRETAWCAAFVNWCLAQAGIYGSGKPNARSFLNVGEKISTPKMGDIVVFWRGSKNSWKGHVAFFVELTPHGQVVCLGGNQNDSVCYRAYSADRVLGYRRV